MAVTDAELIALHAQRATQKQLAEATKMSLSGLRKRMRRLGLKGYSNGSRSFAINEQIFDRIDTEHKAYWLGFLLADGCIGKSAGTRRSLRFSLQKRDEQQVRALAKFLNFRGKFYIDNRGDHPRFCMVFNSVRLCGILFRHGWMEFKQKGDPRIVSTVPDGLFHHFLRGYFDGDGSLTRTKGQVNWHAVIVGPHREVLEYFSCRVLALTGIGRTVNPKGTIYSIVWNGRHQLTTFLDWLYKDATVWLERKKVRMEERRDSVVFGFKSLTKFRFTVSSDQLLERTDKDEVVDNFINSVMASRWVAPECDINERLERLMAVDITRLVKGGQLVPTQASGWQIVAYFQPMVWHVAVGNKPAIASFSGHRRLVERAARAFLLTPGKQLSASRFLREMLFAGFTRASILSVPLIMAAIRHFGFTGEWFDPCSGWGNRLLAAHLLGIKYAGTDPGKCTSGLLDMAAWLGADAKIQDKRWQDAVWCGNFIFTSPPFHNKEDYLDGVDYGKFGDWYVKFLKPLAVRCLANCQNVVFHVDAAMRQALSGDFRLDELPIVSGTRHKAPLEWFVKISPDQRLGC